MKIKLAIIIPSYISKIRDLNILSRPIEFLDIKLFSIKHQVNNFFDVSVIVSDMSPDSDISNQLKNITLKYNYEYKHSYVKDIWNKALCLNRGIQSVINKVDYIMTTDFDIFFSDILLDKIYKILVEKNNHVLLAQTFMLNKDITDNFITIIKEKKLQKEMLYQDNIKKLTNHGNFIDLHANGGVQIFKSKWLEYIHGYDEEFKLWGGIDNEIISRLELIKINRQFIVPKNSEILLCHLCHEQHLMNGISQKTKKYHQMKNLQKICNIHKLTSAIVNPNGWGQ